MLSEMLRVGTAVEQVPNVRRHRRLRALHRHLVLDGHETPPLVRTHGPGPRPGRPCRMQPGWPGKGGRQWERGVWLEPHPLRRGSLSLAALHSIPAASLVRSLEIE